MLAGLGKNVDIVPGGANGIGRGTAERPAAEDARVAIPMTAILGGRYAISRGSYSARQPS